MKATDLPFPCKRLPPKVVHFLHAFVADPRASPERRDRGTLALLQHHIPLALSFAHKKKFRYRLDEEVAVSSAVIGVWKALKKFNPKVGSQFSTFAYCCMHTAFKRAYESQTPFPHSAVQLAHRIRLDPALADTVSPQKLAALLPLGRPQLQLVYSRTQKPVPIPVLDAEPVDATERAILMAEILDLPPRLALIIRARYCFDHHFLTLTQLGAILGLTKERVRQLEHEALRKLQRKMSENISEVV